MLKIFFSFCMALCLLYGHSIAHSIPAPRHSVAILQTIEHPALNATRQGILDELKPQGITIHFQSAQGNSSLAAQIAQQFVGMRPPVLIGIGTLATQALMAADQYLKIPIIFSSVTNPIEAKLLDNLITPNGFITGVSNYVDPKKQFKLFKKILPHLKTLGIIYNPGEPNSVSLLETMQAVAPLFNLRLLVSTANSTAEVAQAMQNLVGKVEAMFINNDNTALSAFDSIVKISNQQKYPVFTSDVAMISRGALAALGPDQYALGRKTGKMILQVLNGTPLNTIPVVTDEPIILVLNPTQAKKLNITFSKDLLKQSHSIENIHE